jgi:hypothetical protein
MTKLLLNNKIIHLKYKNIKQKMERKEKMEKNQVYYYLKLNEWKDSPLFLVVSNCSGIPPLAQGDGHGWHLAITHATQGEKQHMG